MGMRAEMGVRAVGRDHGREGMCRDAGANRRKKCGLAAYSGNTAKAYSGLPRRVTGGSAARPARELRIMQQAMQRKGGRACGRSGARC